MTPDALDGPILAPRSGVVAKQLVVLLHGVGADGNDLIGLAPAFAESLPDAAFLSPHAPFPYDMAPFGRQWFSIRDFGAEARLDGVRAAAPTLDSFLDAILAEYRLGLGALALVGFSQGAMMALHTGLRRAEPIAGILSYSGIMVGEDHLAQEICSRPPVLLVHGEDDPLIPAAALPAATAALEVNGIDVASHLCPRLGHGIDEKGIAEGHAFLARIFAGA
ncbi:MAG: dienelactone hydrolase family protein [Rhodospirillales bacterium]|jgi:phospholipase/carboxylesterase|nr:dienelactone hydrolase family protein [Rhodospirillales bacterium]